MSRARIGLRHPLGASAVAALVTVLAACGSSSSAGSTSVAAKAGGTTHVAVAAQAGAPFTAVTIDVPQVDAIRAKLPQSLRDSGELRIGVGALPAGFPPLAFVGTDQKTLTGSEPDLGRLVASVLGLKPVVSNATWENLFVGFDSGRTDVGFSNITDTEKRKEKYDFASYRQDNLGFEVNKASTWNFDGRYENLAGLRVSVSRGTNQEKILLEWDKENTAHGLAPVKVEYFENDGDTILALQSGRIDVSFGPNPTAAYKASVSPKDFKVVGTLNGGWPATAQIAVGSLKGTGLAPAVTAALNHAFADGTYGQVLARWGLTSEAIERSETNPPGLPKSS